MKDDADRKTSQTSVGKHQESILASSGVKRVRPPGSRRQLKIMVFILFVITASGLAGYFLIRPEGDTYRLRDYMSATVEIRTLQDDLQLGGTVRARTEAMVRAPVNGVLKSVNVEVGDWVEPGDLLANIKAEALEQS